MDLIADVVVIGAGAVGSSTAYHLAKAGVKSIILLDMGKAGSGTSGKSASIFTLQLSSLLNIQMGIYSYHRLMGFEEEFDINIDFKKTGFLSLATEETVPLLLKRVQLLRSLNVKTEILQTSEVEAQYPELNINDISIATWAPDDGKFDPYQVIQGYIKKSREKGVKIYEDVKVIGISTANNKVIGVSTNQGFIHTNMVVNAAGPWAIEIGRLVGIDVPIINSARSIVVTAPFDRIPSNRPCIEDMTNEWYYRPESRGFLMGMGASPTAEIDIEFNDETLMEMIRVATYRVPVFEEAGFLTGWTGVRPMTPDDLPIVGPVSAIDGFLLNCGWGGEGIMQSPLAGQLIAELVTNSPKLPFHIGDFNMERFKGVNLDEITDLRVFIREKEDEIGEHGSKEDINQSLTNQETSLSQGKNAVSNRKTIFSWLKRFRKAP